ncbi:MAG: 2-oxo acid dehydrogenase subunit E2 [Bacteroidetes bacterium]|nr:MAG: 2-oxo acid dehydrogenase subunit E2 [Bacteroidota bacterium]
MARFEIVMPSLGESITEATITRWLKQVGDKVAEDDAIAEIATDKVDSEIPSPVAGVIKELLFQEGDVAEVGKPIVIVMTEGEEVDAEEKAETSKEKTDAPSAQPPSDSSKSDPLEITTTAAISSKGPSGRFYSPLVRNIAREEKITLEELDKIEGSGKEGRVTRDDMLTYLKNRSHSPKTEPQQTSTSPSTAAGGRPVSAPNVKTDSGDEVIEMTRMRKLIVDHMVNSEATSVHVTSVIEIDVTNMVHWREKHKKTFERREGEKLTFTPIFIMAVAKTLKEFPMLNASVSGDKIILRKNINIGMAAALPGGNLIVPVIKNADHQSLIGLAKKVNDLAVRARNNKLQPDEIQGGTFTLTNLGSFDTIIGTPIINQPQVAILATGSIKKRPVVIETEQGDLIGIRHMMYLSMSYDHRIVDGALGGMALKRMGEHLQNWDINQVV